MSHKNRIQSGAYFDIILLFQGLGMHESIKSYKIYKSTQYMTSRATWPCGHFPMCERGQWQKETTVLHTRRTVRKTTVQCPARDSQVTSGSCPSFKSINCQSSTNHKEWWQEQLCAKNLDLNAGPNTWTSDFQCPVIKAGHGNSPICKWNRLSCYLVWWHSTVLPILWLHWFAP